MSNDLKLLRGYPYHINDKLYIKQPTLGEICDYGEDKYFNMISTLVATPSDLKSVLFDIGVDYTTKSEFSLFIDLSSHFTPKKTSILFGDGVDFSKMDLKINPKNEEVMLIEKGVNDDTALVIDSYIYELITVHLRKMHGFKKNIELAGNEYTKNALIEEDRKNRNKKKEDNLFLYSMILTMVNCIDFPYDFESVWNVPISVFMASVQQIQKHKNVGYLMQGIYSGNIDASKINKDELRWI